LCESEALPTGLNSLQQGIWQRIFSVFSNTSADSAQNSQISPNDQGTAQGIQGIRHVTDYKNGI
jgi:hypothetical protein